MDKVGVTLLLRKAGLTLSEAYDATDGILQGRAVTVSLAAGTDVKALCKDLEHLGVVTAGSR